MLNRVAAGAMVALPMLLVGIPVAHAAACDPASGGGSADGYWVCSGSGPGTIGEGGTLPSGAGVSPGGDPDGGSAGASGSGTVSAAGGAPSEPCTYLDFDANRGTPHPAGHAGEAGRWVYVYCGDDGTDGGWLWLASGGALPPTVRYPSPAELAAEAYQGLRLPTPVPDYNPRHRAGYPDGTIVGVDTWLWVDSGSTGSRTVTATAGPNSATVNATVTSVTFDPGDGSGPVSCPDGGTAYVASAPAAASTCEHAYAQSSASAPNGAFTLTATVAWTGRWQGSGGTGGVLPTRSVTGTVPVQVDELQAVNN